MAHYQEIYEKNKTQFIIRNATGEDAEKIFDFMRHVDSETTFLAREPGEFEERYTVESERSLLDSWAEQKEHLFLVAKAADGSIAATCGCVCSTLKRESHTAEIAISVRQDCWRMGLGRRLFEIQESWCREHRIERLSLTVDTKNTRALGLYLSQGFVVEGTLRRKIRLADGSYRDFYQMAKFL